MTERGTSFDNDANRRWWALEQAAFHDSQHGINIAAAFAGAVATTTPLCVGALVQNHSFGLFCALGGLNTALVMGPSVRSKRLGWGLFAALAGALSAGIATLTHQPAWLAVVVVAAWATAWALLRALGPQGTLVGFTTTAVFIVVSGLPGADSQSISRMTEYAVGSLFALVLMMAPSPSRTTTEPKAIPWSMFTHALSRRGVVRSHALRVGVVAGIGTALFHALSLNFGYWIPLTGVAVLQPDAHDSRVRALQRGAGTLVGTAIVALVAVITHNETFMLAIIFVASAALFALKERSYFWLTMLLTPTALLMISTVQFYGWGLAVTRVANTAIGLVLALVVIQVAARRSQPTSE